MSNEIELPDPDKCPRVRAFLASKEIGCQCLSCGYKGTGEEFTVSIGQDDYEGQCPGCGAGEELLESLYDD